MDLISNNGIAAADKAIPDTLCRVAVLFAGTEQYNLIEWGGARPSFFGCEVNSVWRPGSRAHDAVREFLGREVRLLFASCAFEHD